MCNLQNYNKKMNNNETKFEKKLSNILSEFIVCMKNDYKLFMWMLFFSLLITLNMQIFLWMKKEEEERVWKSFFVCFVLCCKYFANFDLFPDLICKNGENRGKTFFWVRKDPFCEENLTDFVWLDWLMIKFGRIGVYGLF